MLSTNKQNIKVIGAGLAGCEAAHRLAGQGFPVTLYEMKPHARSPAHKNDNFAELICSNSLKAMRTASAGGLLKAEMRILGSLLLACADRCAVPAGGALAVDRDEFSAIVTREIEANPDITVIREEVVSLPPGPVIIATGPLTSPALSRSVADRCGKAHLSFFDAASPVVAADSINMDVAFPAARYGRGGKDYLNCPMNKEEYDRFYEALVFAGCVEQKAFEREEMRVYEGCMPVEVLAKRGRDSLRFGPLKPVGITDPGTGRRPWALVQLRQENSAKTLYNMVGFQTNLLFGEQKRVFSMIPGLENAQFARYGVMHRNTFLDSPRILDGAFALKDDPMTFFAGQITGVEGYMESAACGIIAAEQLSRRLRGVSELVLPEETMLGALCRYVSDPAVENFQPMGANMGLLPPLDHRVKGKQERYQALADRALEALEAAVSF